MAKTVRAKGKGAGVRTEPSDEQTHAGRAQKPVISKSTTSFEIFDLCVQRARNMLRLHQAAHGRAGKPEAYYSDAHRAAIVLAVSALDAFVREFILSEARRLLENRVKPLPPTLGDQIKRFLKEDALLEAAHSDDLRNRVEVAFRADFERRSFQGTKIIEEYLQIVGHKNIFSDIATKSGTNEEMLRRDLDRFTQRRHAIAHRGDYNLSQNPPKENTITKKEAAECIALVCRIAKHMHELGSPR